LKPLCSACVKDGRYGSRRGGKSRRDSLALLLSERKRQVPRDPPDLPHVPFVAVIIFVDLEGVADSRKFIDGVARGTMKRR
jgi:hypothetical protein